MHLEEIRKVYKSRKKAAKESLEIRWPRFNFFSCVCYESFREDALLKTLRFISDDWKKKCKTQKQLSFVYEVKFFFTTMTRFIFVNQKLHSKIEEHTGHDFCRTFFELWWHFQLRKKMKVQHLHLSDVKYHQVQNSQFQIISKGPMCFRHFTSGF